MVDTLSAALEREHHEIDAGLEAFLDGLDSGEVRRDELTRAADALRRHIYLEEEILFPPIRDAGLVPPILVMLREHGEIWQTLDALEEAVSESRVDTAGAAVGSAVGGPAEGAVGSAVAGPSGGSIDGAGAGSDRSDALASYCRELLAQLASHNSKEEPVIYPQGDAVLSADAKSKLHEFIEHGAMPDGWVCEQG